MAKNVVRELFIKWVFDIDHKTITALDNSLTNLKKKTVLLGAAFAVTGVGIGYILNEAAKQEKTKIAFDTLLGSAKKADILIRDLFEFAKRTPFTIPGVEAAGKQLLAFGIEQKKIVPTLKALGDAAASFPPEVFGRIVYNYGQIKTMIVANNRELKDFARNGIDIYSALAKVLGVAKDKVLDLVSKRKVLFTDVEKAFQQMTGPGGRFYNMMYKASLTFFGIINNIKDSITILAREMGMSLLPEAKRIANAFLIFLTVNKELIKVKTISFIKIMIRFFKDLGHIIGIASSIFNIFVKAVGGGERALRLLTLTLAVLTGIELARFLGLFTIRIIALTRSIKELGIVTAITNASLAFWPILIGLAVLFIAGVIEDILAWRNGMDSLTESIIKNKKTIKEWLGNFLMDLNPIVSLIKFIDEKFPGNKKAVTTGLGFGGQAFARMGEASGAENFLPKNMSSNRNQNNNVNMSMPITINAASGSPESLKESVTAGIKDGLRNFDTIIQETFRANKRSIVY